MAIYGQIRTDIGVLVQPIKIHRCIYLSQQMLLRHQLVYDHKLYHASIHFPAFQHLFIILFYCTISTRKSPASTGLFQQTEPLIGAVNTTGLRVVMIAEKLPAADHPFCCNILIWLREKNRRGQCFQIGLHGGVQLQSFST